MEKRKEKDTGDIAQKDFGGTINVLVKGFSSRRECRARRDSVEERKRSSKVWKSIEERRAISSSQVEKGREGNEAAQL